MTPIFTILLLPLPIRFLAENTYLMSLASRDVIDLRNIQTINLILIGSIAIFSAHYGLNYFALAIAIGFVITSSLKALKCLRHLEIELKKIMWPLLTCILFCLLLSVATQKLKVPIRVDGIDPKKTLLIIKASFLLFCHFFFFVALSKKTSIIRQKPAG